MGQLDLDDTLRTLIPYLSLCDAVIVSRDSLAVGLRYDEENMFAPMVMLKEKDEMGAAVVRAAVVLEVPVVDNSSLAGSLFIQGKLGTPIPDSCYREVAAILSRNASKRNIRPAANSYRTRRGFKVTLPRPFSIVMGADLFTLMGGGSSLSLKKALAGVQKKLLRLLGFSVPLIKVSKKSSLQKDEYRILFKGVEAGRFHMDLSWYLGNDPLAGDLPVSFSFSALDPRDMIKAAEAASAFIIAEHVDEIAIRRSPDLLGRDEVQALLDAAEEHYPVVTGEVKNFMSLGSIREILQSLVSEQVSIRHIAVILETLADWGNFGPAPTDVMIEQIRQALKRQICLEYTDDRQTLRVLTLDPGLDQILQDRFSANGDSIWDQCLDALGPAICSMEKKGLQPIVLCSPVARSWVKEITRKQFPALAVLSFMEIPPDINVEPVGEIRLAALQQTAVRNERGAPRG